jgi:hypothetical protein
MLGHWIFRERENASIPDSRQAPHRLCDEPRLRATKHRFFTRARTPSRSSTSTRLAQGSGCVAGAPAPCGGGIRHACGDARPQRALDPIEADLAPASRRVEIIACGQL